MESGLYVVATPIGNFGDMSQRAVEVLRSADLIAAEDTRHSKKLLAHYGIGTALQSVHEHNERNIRSGQQFLQQPLGYCAGIGCRYPVDQ